MHSQTKKDVIKSKANSTLPNHTVQSLTDANTKKAGTWIQVDKELSLLNEYLALCIPGPLAAKKDIQLSNAAMKKIRPTKQAQSLLGSVLSKFDHESLHADWLRQKGSKRTLWLCVTISSPSAVQKILGRAASIQKANPTITRLSEERPLDARKLGHKSSGGMVRKRLPDGASLADPKLNARPIVVIARCAPECTPRKSTATPDSGFYSTAADPSNSEGSDALEGQVSRGRSARSTWSYLFIIGYKGAAVNSTPESQLSWTGSDERSQVAQHTGELPTCADVDIGECCENRTTTEAAELTISSSTMSKVVSLIVDTSVVQDPDSQSLKPDLREPQSPSYTQLATPIADAVLRENQYHRSTTERTTRCCPPAPKDWERHLSIKPNQNTQKPKQTEICPNVLKKAELVVRKTLVKGLQVKVVESVAHGEKTSSAKGKRPTLTGLAHGEKSYK
ncbi:hypothetical protein CLF_112299 [Clonorchis sinensis]|uniref:Uncharacterized protein n=1 Tax=Clonorchis sinensis TaxID=79923 RepID=G7YW53_CLOSI|nr:hypothetical protein CLF_112299 [Clonorchis sinensis]